MMGLKRLLLNMHREPKFVKEVMDFCAEFHMGVLRKALDEIELDYIVLSEDVAYKKRPMIGPSMMKEIMSSSYVDLVKFFRDHEVKVIFVDNDGNIEKLVILANSTKGLSLRLYTWGLIDRVAPAQENAASINANCSAVYTLTLKDNKTRISHKGIIITVSVMVLNASSIIPPLYADRKPISIPIKLPTTPARTPV